MLLIAIELYKFQRTAFQFTLDFIRNCSTRKLHVVLKVFYLFQYRNFRAIRSPAENLLPDTFCDSCQQSARVPALSDDPT